MEISGTRFPVSHKQVSIEIKVIFLFYLPPIEITHPPRPPNEFGISVSCFVFRDFSCRNVVLILKGSYEGFEFAHNLFDLMPLLFLFAFIKRIGESRAGSLNLD